MKKRNLQNERLDRIGRKLLEARRVSAGEELDKIVGAPQLFEAVKAGIRAERRERRSKSRSGNWQSLLVWNRQKTVAALAVLMIFALGAFGLIAFTKQDSSATLAEKITLPEIRLPFAPVEIPPPAETFEAPPEIAKTENSARKNRVIFRKAVFKNEAAALPKRAPRKKNPVRRQTEIEPDGEFYALTYGGNPGEAGEDLRIIRAELSRASLFALGVNLPIENESEKIKTDLLVGADGVAKAIRFVK
ncbi:MAG TPA: hypothetical protein VF599_02800 [Pyrinomonadaceae bacterium]